MNVWDIIKQYTYLSIIETAAKEIINTESRM